MTFLNATLLIALAGVAIPIALHFIARKEPRQVTFPSVRLLTQRFQTNRSKVRICRWWLLALRIATLATVALAMARPVIASALSLTWTTMAIIAGVGVAVLVLASLAARKPDQRRLMWALFSAALVALVAAIGWGGYTLASGRVPDIDRSTPVALAIVVDNLALADWNDGQTSQLDRIRDAAKQLVMAANPNSRLAVIDRSATPAAFSLDLASAVSKADSLSTQELVQPLESRMEAAARLLTTSEIDSRQLV